MYIFTKTERGMRYLACEPLCAIKTYTVTKFTTRGDTSNMLETLLKRKR